MGRGTQSTIKMYYKRPKRTFLEQLMTSENRLTRQKYWINVKFFDIDKYLVIMKEKVEELNIFYSIYCSSTNSKDSEKKRCYV